MNTQTQFFARARARGLPLALASFAAMLTAACEKAEPLIMPLGPSDFPVMSFEADYVLARGTWTIEREYSAAAANINEIQCYKSSMTCLFISAGVTNSPQSRYLDVSSERHPVALWTDERVILEAAGRCRKIITTIDRASRSVTQVQTLDLDSAGCEPDGNGNDALGLPLLTEPRIVKLMAMDETRQTLEALQNR